MSRLVHLNALLALEAALRTGTLRAAAQELGVTQAAVGQRIRALEIYLGAPLLCRGAAGVSPTPLAEAVRGDLGRAFAQLEMVSEALNLDREGQLRLRVDPDLSTLWLRPRLAEFRQAHPGVQVDLIDGRDAAAGRTDIEMFWGADPTCPPLWDDWLVPVLSAEIMVIAQANAEGQFIEGVPLLHLADRPAGGHDPGWADWVACYGQRLTGIQRGVRVQWLVDGLRAAADGSGVLLVPRSLIGGMLARGDLLPLLTPNLTLETPNRFRLRVSPRVADRRPVRQFCDWLQAEADIWGRSGGIGPFRHELAMELGRPAR